MVPGDARTKRSQPAFVGSIGASLRADTGQAAGSPVLTDEEVVTGGELTVQSEVPLEGWSTRPLIETNRHGEDIAFAVKLGVDGGAASLHLS